MSDRLELLIMPFGEERRKKEGRLILMFPYMLIDISK